MKKGNKGVTLVELLVASAIFSIIIAVGTFAFTYFNKNYNKQVEYAMSLSNVRYAINYITREIRRADTVDIRNDILTVNGTDVYKLESEAITKNGTQLIKKIKKFSISQIGYEIKIEITGTEINGDSETSLSSTIYIRQEG